MRGEFPGMSQWIAEIVIILYYRSTLFYLYTICLWFHCVPRRETPDFSFKQLLVEPFILWPWGCLMFKPSSFVPQQHSWEYSFSLLPSLAHALCALHWRRLPPFLLQLSSWAGAIKPFCFNWKFASLSLWAWLCMKAVALSCSRCVRATADHEMSAASVYAVQEKACGKPSVSQEFARSIHGFSYFFLDAF